MALIGPRLSFVAKGKSKKPGKLVTPSETRSGHLDFKPFLALQGLKIPDPAPPPLPSPPMIPPPKTPEDDASLFQAAMAEVAPMKKTSQRVRLKGNRPDWLPADGLYSEDLEVLTRLEDLVAGHGHFDILDSDEYIEGSIRGLHPVILEKLRLGRFSVQDHLDLHGLTVKEARELVAEFISEAVARKQRCLLLIHGRGLNSKDQVPVLKKTLEKILLTAPIRKHILAYTSARPHDGGVGASYVLLRAKR